MLGTTRRPPKLMLEESYPHNLVTIPACQGCNKKFTINNEYTRTFIALDFRAAASSSSIAATRDMPLARAPACEGPLRQLKGPVESDRSRRRHRQASWAQAEVDVSRIDAAGERFARGFYYNLTRTLVPGEWQVWVYSKPGYNSTDFIVPNFNATIDKCGDHTHGHIGSDFTLPVAGASRDAYSDSFYEYFW